MADNGVENNSGSQNVEKQIEQKVVAQTQEQIKQEMDRLKDTVDSLKIAMRASLEAGKTQHYFEGNKEDKDSPKGMANSVKEFIHNMFVTAKIAPEKVPAAEKQTQTDPKAPILTPKSTELIKKLGEKISLDDIKDQTAPYLYDLLLGITNGTIKSSEDLSDKVKELSNDIRYNSPGLFKKLQDAGVDYAKESGHEEKDAKQMFGVQEATEGTKQDYENQRKAAEVQLTKQTFDRFWQEYYSSYFSEGKDKNLIQSLYSPEEFIKYYQTVQGEVARDYKNLDAEGIAKKASSEMEVRTSLLFAKLYTKLDHESPKEYFQSIEQADVMRGIIPVKEELKRRINRLASDLHHYKPAKDVVFYRQLEEDKVTDAIDVGEGNLKPRSRLILKLKPTVSDGGDFAHYLDQIADHYIDARRYTHNARAILLRPGEPGKSFYTQLAHFAGETSTLDFDQMMLLPDNDIFQSAFGLYNKMIEQGFANTDWRHSSAMFMPKPNQHLTQIEERVLNQLKAMFADRPEIDEPRLQAALTMAVGASRGMFLTEQEMSAHADPHLDEKGKSTFTSYYHQDATALMAFNPQHLLYRFSGGPQLLDPIFFLPLASFKKGSQAFNNHHALWDKARLYKKSFLEGREKLPEKTFFDMLDNIGLIGGPMQRKGWRSQWQFDSLYVNDKIEMKDKKGTVKIADKINFVKSFKYFENIGYELLQDYVTKLDFLDGGFAKVRDTPGLDEPTKRLVNQKKELFEYIFEKYFDKDPKDLRTYLDGIRKTKKDEVVGKIRKGLISPKNIDDEVEGEVSKAFLDRMLARVITKRLPSKILCMDRDRLSKNGISRYRQVMMDMGLEGQFDSFETIMQDMILAEQMMRKNVSTQMRALREANSPNKEDYAKINYEMTEESIKSLLGPLIGKNKMTQERLDNVLKLFGHIQEKYGRNDEFINKELVPFFKNGGAIDRESKYTIALDETDLSFIPFRGGGETVLARSIRDIASVEENVSKPITELVKKLRMMAIDGKKDFGPILEIITKVHMALDGIIGPVYANEMSSKLAAMTVMYMKKDTQARGFMGIFGVGKFNSMAAESAGKKVGIWEWDSTDTDRWYTALEARALIPGTPYNIAQEPTPEPVYITIPFIRTPVKLPDKIETSKLGAFFGITLPDIPLFTRRHHDWTAWSKQEREKFGGTKYDMVFDILNRYLPLMLALILFKQMKDALEDSEGKKK